MKKLFLFILVLFGILSAQSLAGGCNAQICICPGGGTVSTNQYCPVPNTYDSRPAINFPVDVFAYDKDSGAYGIGSNVNTGKAKKEALENCGTKNCKITLSGGGFVIASSNGIVLSIKTNNIEYTKYMEKKTETLKKCENKGGTNCKVIYDTKNFHYDVGKEYPDRGW